MHDDGVRTLPEGYVLGFGIRRYHMPGDGESFAGAVQLRAAVFDGGEVADGAEEYADEIHRRKLYQTFWLGGKSCLWKYP
jgi:hypothetical protein